MQQRQMPYNTVGVSCALDGSAALITRHLHEQQQQVMLLIAAAATKRLKQQLGTDFMPRCEMKQINVHGEQQLLRYYLQPTTYIHIHLHIKLATTAATYNAPLCAGGEMLTVSGMQPAIAVISAQ
ncbi:unnamed protein product [Ceratitis capitata]|uniref:(Mediterranean fruit fly) hypothetical protein n=1 Tax=Ceratitis capitata TaxID=7213 RepID=A0A811UHA2_CERCA|nr:unnamed protein product [Ceratitis capitata]